MNELPSYDLVVHLCGGQPLPIHYGARLLQAPRHLFAVTPESRAQFKLFHPLLEKQGLEVGKIEVSPYDPGKVTRAIRKEQKRFEAQNVALNLTGGTKLMFVGGQEAMRQYGFHGYYFETATRKVHLLHASSEIPRELPPIFESVDEFFALAKEKIAEPGHWEDEPIRQERFKLTRLCGPYPALMSKITVFLKKQESYLVKRNQETREIESCGEFEKEARQTNYKTKQKDTIKVAYNGAGRGSVELNGKKHVLPDCPDFFDYLTGRWFEEYCHSLLEPLLERGSLKDLRIGLKTKVNMVTDFKGNMEERTYQEIDLCYTDGHELFVVECKSGNVSQEAVQKLENIVQKYGGVQARGLLASCFRPQAQFERLDRSNRLLTVHGKNLAQLLPERALTPLDAA